MFDNIGTTEFVIIGVVILIFFGSSKLKEVAKGLGESGRELKKVKREFDTAMTEVKSEPEEPVTQPEKKKATKKAKTRRKEGGKNNV